MPNLIMTKLKDQDHEKTVKAKILTFLNKLTDDDSLPGLNIERMNEPLDPRVRTGRVDIHLRAVLYRLEPLGGERTYVYAGTWPHDIAIERARTRKLQINPVNGIAQIIEADPEAGSTRVAAADPLPIAPAATLHSSYLADLSYFPTDLTTEFGFPEELSQAAFHAGTEDELLDLAGGLENEWQVSVLLGMAMHQAISVIKESLAIEDTPPQAEEPEDASDRPGEDDQRLVEALKHPAAQMQFTVIEGEEELERVIDGGDFGAWRVFLHPEQRRYATRHYNGPFRLTGGAGTGKTVVLLHRAKKLSVDETDRRVILTTYTRALAENLRRDLERLDPEVGLASGLGEPGVLVRGVDQLAAAVREAAGMEFGSAALTVLGASVESRGSVIGNDHGWEAAVDDSGAELPPALRSKNFLSVEYLQVVLPNRIVTKDQYFAIRRPGRGIPLDRMKRAEVWKVVEQYRKNARIANTLSYAEVAAVGAAWLEGSSTTSRRHFGDHILIDEAQDLTAAHWQLLRAIVAPGPDDMFIADDAHQRIYGQPIVLSRLGIAVVGRSRRLTLNYRTTEQNLRYALDLLVGGAFVDSEDSEVGVSGYRSSRSGPVPELVATSSNTEQYTKVAERVTAWLDEGVSGETIAILTTSNNASKDIHDALDHYGIESTVLTSAKQSGSRPVILTMYTSKGMEFSRVVLFDISDGAFPSPWALKGVAPEDRADVLLRERSLLYVAASRARDELVITWSGQPSGLLNPQ